MITKDNLFHNKVNTLGVSYLMNKRMTDRVESRPDIPSIKITDIMSRAEDFQNSVLRPIIKMKNDLLLAYFINYIAVKKVKWKDLSAAKKVDYLESVFRNDQSFRCELRGLVIGNFTLKEYTQYIDNQSDINKRMINIIRKRIIDHLETINIK